MLYNAWRHVLVSLRRRRDLSQNVAARRAGVSPVTWYRWEAGLTSPVPGQLEAIARAVRCSPQKLGYEYSRLLYRFYCHQMGYECPTAPPARSAVAPRSMPKPEPDVPAPHPTTAEGETLPPTS